MTLSLRPLPGFLMLAAALAGPAMAAGKVPETYYTAQPQDIVDEVRQTPRPQNGMTPAQMRELDKVVLPRALTCEAMFYDDARMMQRIKSWPLPFQNQLANECRRVIADSNEMQRYLARVQQAEQEQARRKAEEDRRRDEEQRRRDEAARQAEQRETFLAQRPNFLLLLNAGSPSFQVTRSLEGRTVVARAANAPSSPIPLELVRATAQSSTLLLDRYERLPAPLAAELKALVAELAKARGLVVDTRGLDKPQHRSGASSKCVVESVVARGGGPGAPDRVCRNLQLGLFDAAEFDRIKPLVDSGNIIVLGEIPGDQLQARAEATARRAAEAAAAEAQRKKDVIAQIGARPDDIVALVLPASRKAGSCTLSHKGRRDTAWAVSGYATLPDFAKEARLEPDHRFDEFTDDLEALWTLVQKGQCSGVILGAAEMARLIPAVEREGLDFKLLPLRERTELQAASARSRGFDSLAQFEFAADLKADAAQAKALAGFGITNLPGVRSATARMKSSGYAQSDELAALLEFLDDEAQGAKTKRSAVQVRAARAAEAQARERDRAERLRRELPLYSVRLACMEPMGHLAETMVGHLARSPAAFIQMMAGSVSNFCSQIILPVTDPALVASARLIDRDAGGAEYYVVKAADGRSVLGLVKRRAN